MREYVGYCIQEEKPTPDKPCEIKTKVIGKNLLEPVEYLQQKEIERLHSIIKEVREYIENHSITNMEWWITGEQKIECKFMKDTNPQELLEILDKES